MKNKTLAAVIGICSCLTASAFAAEVDFDRGTAAAALIAPAPSAADNCPKPHPGDIQEIQAWINCVQIAPAPAANDNCPKPHPGNIQEIQAWLNCLQLPPAPANKAIAATAAVCRDAFVTLMGEQASGSIPNMKKSFEGVNTADQSACRMNITYAETPEKRGGVYVEVLNSPLDPFNHYVPASNEDASCSAANASVSARYSWKQDFGWHHRFTTELSIKKLQGGMLEVTYSQDNGPELRCVGTIR